MAEGFRIIVGMYNPELPDIYQLIHYYWDQKKQNEKPSR